MLQKEVVDRMVSPPGGKTYGRLSAVLQRYYRMMKLFDVPPGAFTPAPKVTSSVVRMIPIAREETSPEEDAAYSEVVAASFSMRRKTLRNSLGKLLTAEEIESAGINPGVRAETLSVSDFESLTRVYLAKRAAG